MDYTVPEPLEHYKAILKGLAKLSGTHLGGSGALSGAEPFIWNEHLDELLTVFIEEYAAQGGHG
jgi:hypothetical protein